MNEWTSCRNILIIRLDNMGDLLMSEPAIRALKESFNCKISVLTSSAARPIIQYIPVVDDVIIFDAPWMKDRTADPGGIESIVKLLASRHFDAAFIFTVFSQNPAPAAVIAYLAGIPLRIAYSRENLYGLLTEWLPDKEPYEFVRHQVRRDLDLVKHIGANTADERIAIAIPDNHITVKGRLKDAGVDLSRPWLIVHPGVSEEKRLYPIDHWIEAVTLLTTELKYQVIITGVDKEAPLAEHIKAGVHQDVFNLAGKLSLDEFISLVNLAPLVITVNTSTAHIAAAVQTKIVVLYAMTNPQHTPWLVAGHVLPFPVKEHLKSKNEVLRYVTQEYFPKSVQFPEAFDILQAARELLYSQKVALLPENFNFRDVGSISTRIR